MRLDLAVKPKQGFWETPRNLYIVLYSFLAVVAVVAVVSAVVGFEFGRTLARQTQSIQIIFPPGTVVTIPPASK